MIFSKDNYNVVCYYLLNLFDIYNIIKKIMSRYLTFVKLKQHKYFICK